LSSPTLIDLASGSAVEEDVDMPRKVGFLLLLLLEFLLQMLVLLDEEKG
jgi:hypothetical protein